MYKIIRVKISLLFLISTFGIHGQSFYYGTSTDVRKLDSIIEETWNEPDRNWIITGKYQYYYNFNGSNDSTLRYLRDLNSSKWIYMSKWVHFYDHLLRDTLTSQSWWDPELSQWYIWDKIQRGYDLNDSLIQFTYSAWGDTPYHIVPVNKIQLEYQNSLRSKSISYRVDQNTSEWTYSFMDEYAYNDMGNLTNQNTYLWDLYLNQWNPATTEITRYDASGKKINFIRRNWDFNSNNWIDNISINYTYNSLKKPAVETYYKWNPDKQLWIPYTKITYDYDGNTVVKKLYNSKLWNGIFPPFTGGASWEMIFKDEYTYNDYGELIIHVSHIWISVNSVWTIIKKTYFISSHQFTPVNNWSDEEIKIYPNPASDFISIGLPESLKRVDFEIFNLQGSQVLHKTITESCQINISSLAKGLYLYRIGNKNKITKGKIIIE